MGDGYASNAEALLEDVEIIGNTITHPYSSGIYIDATMKNIKIAGNNIIDPALTQTRDDLKCAIKLEGRMQDVIIEKNIIKDNQLPHVLRSLIYDAGSNIGGCIYNNENKIVAKDNSIIPVYSAANKYQGTPWK